MRCTYVVFVCSLITCAFFKSTSGFATFNQACNQTYYAHHLNDSRPGLVDENGRPVTDIKLAAGIDSDKCYEVCGGGYQDFYFLSFALSFTTWLLPWLALTAQLPFEASDTWANLMSLLLALGSPAIISQSVTLTILNGYCIRQKFKDLRERSKNFGPGMPNRFDNRIKAAALIVQESQQVPMRASQDNGWLGSLVVLGENQSWWENAEKHIWNTRRGVTFSLIAQISMALIAWVLTVLGALLGNLGDTTTVLQLSSGSLWLWMIPVISGWIMGNMTAHASIFGHQLNFSYIAGTQSSSKTIRNALLDRNHRATRVRGQQDANGEAILLKGKQMGILNRTGFATRPQPSPDSGIHQVIKPGNPVTTALRHIGPNIGPTHSFHDAPQSQNFYWLSFSVTGDEAEAGPIYNYARLFTWWAFANTVEDAFRKTVENLEQRRRVDDKPWDDAPVAKARVVESIQGAGGLGEGQPELSESEPSLLGSRTQVAEYCGLNGAGRAYLEWSDIPPEAWHHMFYAIAAAMWIQWGTTGASIMMAYLTPTVGLGCRSGAYLLYGSVATFAWFLLIVSSLFSHAVLLRHQRLFEDDNTESRSPTNEILGGLAVVTRKLGKTLAALNAVFLFTTCMFEYTGFYGRCWCKTNALSTHGRGYSVIFLTANDLAAYSQKYWAAGFVFLIVVTCLPWLCFRLFCKDNWRSED